MSELTLRPYQMAAYDGLMNWFPTHDGNPLVVMPTGSGKSHVIAHFLRSAVEAWPSTRALLLSHVKELLVQDYGALMHAWPDAPAGIYSASLGRRDIGAQLLVAGIQSIHKRAYEIQQCDLIIIDEAHLIGREGGSMYRKFLTDLKQINPHLRVIGFTATPYRLDTGRLDEGKDKLFDGVAYEVGILELIEQGYLCPVIPKETITQLDLSGVAMRGGEYVPSQLEEAVDIEEITNAAVDEVVQAGKNRGSWLLFCSGVDHALHVRDAVRKWGVSCETVTGSTPTVERDRIIREFKAGRIRAVTSVGVLTTGFDAPGVDLIAMLRPTGSKSLHVQMLGRGTRLANGKVDCIVLDFAGNTLQHGPLDMIDGRKAGKAKDPNDPKDPPPAKTCPECKTIVGIGVRICGCGHEFPPPALLLTSVSITAPLLSTQIKPEWIEVRDVSYARHTKSGGQDSLVVTYQCGLISHREWICIEHTGYPRQKAVDWWAKREPGVAVPNSIAAALDRAPALPRPTAIQVQPEGKYVAIIGVKF